MNIDSPATSQGPLNRLMVHPFLQGLSSERQQAVANDTRRFPLPSPCCGDVALSKDQILLCTSGRAQVYCNGHWDRLLEPGQTLGTLTHLAQPPHPFVVRDLQGFEGFTLSLEQVDRLAEHAGGAWPGLTAARGLELAGLYQDRLAAQEHTAGRYIEGSAGLIRGPYHFKGVQMRIFVMEDLSGEAFAGLEKTPDIGRQPLTGNRYLLVIAEFHEAQTRHPLGQGESFRYQETAVFFPCQIMGLTPGFFCPEIYPDNQLAIVLGREVYGLPKRFGRTDLQPNKARLVLDNALALEASWAREETIEPREFVMSLTTDLLGLKPKSAKLCAADLLVRLALDCVLPRWNLHVPVPITVRERRPKAFHLYSGKALPTSHDCRNSVPVLLNPRCFYGDATDFRRLEKPEVRFWRHFLGDAKCISGLFATVDISMNGKRKAWDYTVWKPFLNHPWLGRAWLYGKEAPGRLFRAGRGPL